MNKLKFLILLLIGCNVLSIRTTAQCAAISDPCTNRVTVSPSATVNACQGTWYTFNTTVSWTGLTDLTYSVTPTITILPIPPNTLSSTVYVPNTTTPTTYCVTAWAYGPNIIKNGSFTAGANCFTQDAPYITANWLPGTGDSCRVCPNITWITPLLNARTAPNMFVVNGSTAPIPPLRSFWNQTVNVCSGATYQFELYYANINGAATPAQRASLRIMINGSIYGPFSTNTVNTWTPIRFEWLATAPTANIRIIDLNNIEMFNDFAVDDISFRRKSVATRCVTVVPKPQPFANVVGPACQPVCPGMPVIFTITGTAGSTVNFYTTPGSGGAFTTPGSVTIPGTTGTATTSVTVYPPASFTSGIFTLNITSVTGPGVDGCTRNYFYTNFANVRIGKPTATLYDARPCPGDPIMVTGTPNSTVYITDGLNTYTVTLNALGFGSFTLPASVTTPGTYCITKVVGCSCTNYGPFPCVTITPILPPTASITGPTTICLGGWATLTGSPSGGVWTWGPGTTGLMTPWGVTVWGTSLGTKTVTYTVTRCGITSTTTHVVNVIGPPTVTPILPTPPPVFCPGTTVALSNATAGGVWSSSNSSVATIHPLTGVVSVVMPGTTTIVYTVTNPCGSATAKLVINVPKPGILNPIRNLPKICVGQTVYLYHPTTGGVWSSANSSIATVDPSSGLVTAVSSGTVLISYTVTFPCNIASVSVPVTVYPTPTISGPSVICGSSTVTLSADVPGGTWSSSNTGVATVDENTGDVFGVYSGTSIITYTTVNGCSDTFVITNVPDTTVCPYYDHSINMFVIPGAPGATVDYMLGTTYPGTSWLPGTFTCTAPPCYLPPVGFTCVQIVGYTYMGCTSTNSCIACVNPGRQAGNNTTDVASVNNEQELSSVSLTPNPNNGEFTINSSALHINDDSELPLEVVNMLGQVVYRDIAVVKNSRISKTIRLEENCANGMYLVRLKHDGTMKIIRFVLKR